MKLSCAWWDMRPFCSKFCAESSSERTLKNRLIFREVNDASRVSWFFLTHAVYHTHDTCRHRLTMEAPLTEQLAYWPSRLTAVAVKLIQPVIRTTWVEYARLTGFDRRRLKRCKGGWASSQRLRCLCRSLFLLLLLLARQTAGPQNVDTSRWQRTDCVKRQVMWEYIPVIFSNFIQVLFAMSWFVDRSELEWAACVCCLWLEYCNWRHYFAQQSLC